MISVIIVTWNSEEYISLCLKSVKEQTEKDIEIIIIDNDSQDSTKELIKISGSDIIIENSKNMGFAGANNQGINVSKGEYVLTLNPDAILSPDFLEKAKEKMIENEKIGMVSGQLLRPSGMTDSRGISLSNIRRFHDIGEGQGPGGQGQGVELIGPCAAAGFYRRKMLEDIKIDGEYFDEDFFAYAEDVDLAWRANIFGWKAVYCPEAKAVHYRGGSGINSDWKQYLSFRNRYLMILKNEALAHFVKYLPLFIFYDLSRAVYLIFKNQYVFNNNCKNTNLMSKAWKKRKLILKN